MEVAPILLCVPRALGVAQGPGCDVDRRKKEREPFMAIEIKLDLVLVQKKMTLTELSSRIGISITNLSLLKTGKVKGIRFSTLDSICRELECQPGDILEYVPDYV